MFKNILLLPFVFGSCEVWGKICLHVEKWWGTFEIPTQQKHSNGGEPNIGRDSWPSWLSTQATLLEWFVRNVAISLKPIANLTSQICELSMDKMVLFLVKLPHFVKTSQWTTGLNSDLGNPFRPPGPKKQKCHSETKYIAEEPRRPGG